tara:strand:- start:474 stop:764 length:291 start_codon:yes stop_codon:yes gene_type:complete
LLGVVQSGISPPVCPPLIIITPSFLKGGKMDYKIFYFDKDNEETFVIMAHKNQVKNKEGQFVRIYKQFERDGWSMKEVKQKIEPPKVFHPQTGEEI